MKLLLCLTAIIALATSTPIDKRSSNRAVMFAGFVGRHPMEQPGFVFNPQMCKKCVEHDLPPSEEPPQADPGTFAQGTQMEVVQVSQKPVFEEAVTQTVETSGGTAETEQESDEESDEEDDDFAFPIFGRKAGGSYNFFPIVFGGSPGRSGGVGGPTAIANSFSTGKKGVATSHATSYGSSARNDDVPVRTKRSPQETLPDQVSLPIPEEPLPESPQVAEPIAEDSKKVEESEEDDGDNFPVLWRAAGRNAVYNFFPMQFGGFRGRSGIPAGGSTAIANSFATGRKGVATSHATAYGSGYEPENQIRTRRSPQADIEPNLISSEPEPEITAVTEEIITEVPEDEVPVTEVVSTTEIPTPKPRAVPRRKTNPQLNFFPITFARVSGRSSADSPGGATAIANSFSSGRGGISISHATSHGL